MTDVKLLLYTIILEAIWLCANKWAQNAINKMCLQNLYLIYKNEQDVSLNNLERLIYHKTQTINLKKIDFLVSGFTYINISRPCHVQFVAWSINSIVFLHIFSKCF